MGQVNELKDFTRGQLDAALMQIGQEAGMGTADGIRAFLAHELVISKPVRSWRKDPDGTIRLSVTSNGLTGEQWIAHFEKKGIRLSDWAKSVLRSTDFRPTTGVTTEIAVLPGEMFNDTDRCTSNIRAKADERKFVKPNAEVVCLIRDNFSDEEIEAMGLIWIVAMHEPINDSGGLPSLLGAVRRGGGRWLRAYYDQPGLGWGRGCGFAFVVPQA